MSVSSFEDIAGELTRRVERTIWCTMATADARGRIRSRIVHPLWDGRVGWLLTDRHSPKGRDLDGSAWTSFTYIDSAQEQVHVDCRTEWVESLEEKRRVWAWFASIPPPLGYDPGLFFKDGVEAASFGLVRLLPWRVELWSLADLMAGTPPRVWRA